MAPDHMKASTAATAMSNSATLADRTRRDGFSYAGYLTVVGLGFAGTTLVLSARRLRRRLG